MQHLQRILLSSDDMFIALSKVFETTVSTVRGIDDTYFSHR